MQGPKRAFRDKTNQSEQQATPGTDKSKQHASGFDPAKRAVQSLDQRPQRSSPDSSDDEHPSVFNFEQQREDEPMGGMDNMPGAGSRIYQQDRYFPKPSTDSPWGPQNLRSQRSNADSDDKDYLSPTDIPYGTGFSGAPMMERSRSGDSVTKSSDNSTVVPHGYRRSVEQLFDKDRSMIDFSNLGMSRTASNEGTVRGDPQEQRSPMSPYFDHTSSRGVYDSSSSVLFASGGAEDQFDHKAFNVGSQFKDFKEPSSFASSTGFLESLQSSGFLDSGSERLVESMVMLKETQGPPTNDFAKVFIEKTHASLLKDRSFKKAETSLISEISELSDERFNLPSDNFVHRIHAFQSGEVPIHSASMHFDSSSVIEIYYDSKYFLHEAIRSSLFEGSEGPFAHQRFLDNMQGKSNTDSDKKIFKSLIARGYEAAAKMRKEFASFGIDESRVRIIYHDASYDDKIRTEVSRSHATVANAFSSGDVQARESLIAGIEKQIDPSRQDEIVQAIDRHLARLNPEKPVYLFWVRKSGLSLGGAYPELDTHDKMFAQLVQQAEQSGGQVLLIGDDPGREWTKRYPRNLVKFWDKNRLGLNENLTRGEQAWMLQCMDQHFNVFSIGMESGALEMPAMLGIKTIYFEPTSMRLGKAMRWDWVTGALTEDLPGGDPQAWFGPVPNWQRQLFEAPTEFQGFYDRLKRIAGRAELWDNWPREMQERLFEAAYFTLSELHNRVCALGGDTSWDITLATQTSAAEHPWIDLNAQLEKAMPQIMLNMNFDREILFGGSSRRASPSSGRESPPPSLFSSLVLEARHESAFGSNFASPESSMMLSGSPSGSGRRVPLAILAQRARSDSFGNVFGDPGSGFQPMGSIPEGAISESDSLPQSFRAAPLGRKDTMSSTKSGSSFRSLPIFEKEFIVRKAQGITLAQSLNEFLRDFEQSHIQYIGFSSQELDRLDQTVELLNNPPSQQRLSLDEIRSRHVGSTSKPYERAPLGFYATGDTGQEQIEAKISRILNNFERGNYDVHDPKKVLKPLRDMKEAFTKMETDPNGLYPRYDSILRDVIGRNFNKLNFPTREDKNQRSSSIRKSLLVLRSLPEAEIPNWSRLLASKIPDMVKNDRMAFMRDLDPANPDDRALFAVLAEEA